MQIAFYKGSWALRDIVGDPCKFLGHVAVCIGTLSNYSHAELVIDGVCWSSSARDKGVRDTRINLNSGHWDVFDVVLGCDEAQALKWFQEHKGLKYDWLGIIRFVLPFVKQKDNQWFCSEAVAAALGEANPYKLSPKKLLKFVYVTLNLART
jgi:hypothetical protein